MAGFRANQRVSCEKGGHILSALNLRYPNDTVEMDAELRKCRANNLSVHVQCLAIVTLPAATASHRNHFLLQYEEKQNL